MPIVPRDHLQRLGRETTHIRNICILAHVDHGKTTLSDSLLATNGIISNKMAGKIRYLDSREDEQERGITMKSSAVALYFKIISSQPSSEIASEPRSSEYLVHLIDSPGHVDFSNEVSVASRLCDGALILVDVVEGVCTQTLAVLRQAFNERVKPILVLNKIDRLITELRYSTLEAYAHLSKIIEQANAIVSSFQREGSSSPDTPEVSFDPAAGNVLFSSAIDGWAFRLSDFVTLFLPKLKGVNAPELVRGLWGNHTYSSKESKIVQRKEAGWTSKNLFCQLILDNIWAIYESTQLEFNLEKIEKMIANLHLKINPFELRSKETKGISRVIMSQWLPLSRAVLLYVIGVIPSPLVSQQSKFETFY